MEHSIDGASKNSENELSDTFYSSMSTDNLEHARSFRNSVVLPSDAQDDFHESGWSMNGSKLHEHKESDSSGDYATDTGDEEEVTKTLKITASPSLSALAGILNEKAQQAERKMRSSTILEDTIAETVPEEEEEGSEGTANINQKDDKVVEEAEKGTAQGSPNLIDMDDEHGDNSQFNFPSKVVHLQVDSEQPDFLTTPKLDPPTPRVEPAGSNAPTPPIGVARDYREPQQDTQQDTQQEAQQDTQQEAQQDTQQDTQQNSQQEYQQVNSANKVVEHDISTEDSPSPKPLTEAVIHMRPVTKKQASLRSFSGVSVGSFTSTEQSVQEAAPGKKRKSIFSFLKKKPQKSASFMVQNNNSSSTLPTSSTFSVTKSSEKEDLPSSTKLTKKSHSNGSIFSTFRKNKTQKKETIAVDRSLKNPKVRTSSDRFKDSQSSSGGRDVQTRKPTPLNFEHNQELLQSAEKSPPASVKNNEDLTETVPQVTVKAPPPEADIPEDTTSGSFKADSGGVLFPKSLSAQEVESIVSLERSRSVKSTKRNSLSSHRRSLTENMSAKAISGGMFITEPSSVKLSTPDLSKSPTSSILRNGTFDTLESSPRRSSTGDHYNLSISSIPLRPQDRDFSFTSIEEKLNDITIESGSEDELTFNSKGATSPPVQENFDTEFMSDIMEFASIIDFGKDLDLNLDLDQNDTTYKSLNPFEQQQNPDLSREETSMDSFNFGPNVHDLPPRHHENYLSQSQGNRSSGQDDYGTADSEYSTLRGHEVLLSPPLNDEAQHELDFLRADDDDEEFEGEDFNQLEESLQSPGISSPTWRSQISSAGRPLSLSFKGLRAHQLNSNSDTSISRPYPTDYTASGSMVTAHTQKTVSFSSNIMLFATYTESEYDRHPDVATCNQLTPQLAQIIKEELNTLKAEMDVHEESRCYTHFF